MLLVLCRRGGPEDYRGKGEVYTGARIRSSTLNLVLALTWSLGYTQTPMGHQGCASGGKDGAAATRWRRSSAFGWAVDRQTLSVVGSGEA